MKYYTTLDKDVKRLANSRGLRLTDVYLLCGINSTTFNDIRKKNNCTTDQLFKLCQALNAPISAFIHSTENEENNIVNEAPGGSTSGPAAVLKELENCKKLCFEKDKRLELYEMMIKKL